MITLAARKRMLIRTFYIVPFVTGALSAGSASAQDRECPSGEHLEGGRIIGNDLVGGHCVKNQPLPPPLPTHLPPAPDLAEYSFSLDAMHISKTRSPRRDTDIVSFALKIGSQTYQPYVKPMGDLADGDYAIGLRFGPVNVKRGDPVVFSYIIANSGYDASNEATGQTVTNLISSAAGALTNSLVAPGLGTLGDFATHQLNGIFFSNCDGVVVADTVDRPTPSGGIPQTNVPQPGQPITPFTGQDLWSLTYGGTRPYTESRRYPGTNSPVGCGENSLYFVTWTISRD